MAVAFAGGWDVRSHASVGNRDFQRVSDPLEVPAPVDETDAR